MVDTIFSSMKRELIKEKERERASLGRDIRDVETRIEKMPSQLDKKTKKKYRKELAEEKSFYSRMRKTVGKEKSQLDKRAKKIASSRKRIAKKISKALQKKVVSRKVLKQNQATVTIKERQPAEYISTFFKDELEETKNAMFFK